MNAVFFAVGLAALLATASLLVLARAILWIARCL